MYQHDMQRMLEYFHGNRLLSKYKQQKGDKSAYRQQGVYDSHRYRMFSLSYIAGKQVESPYCGQDEQYKAHLRKMVLVLQGIDHQEHQGRGGCDAVGIND